MIQLLLGFGKEQSQTQPMMIMVLLFNLILIIHQQVNFVMLLEIMYQIIVVNLVLVMLMEVKQL